MTRRDSKPPYGEKFLAKLRKRLEAKVRDLRADCETLAADVLRPSEQESGFETPADHGTDEFTEEMQADLLEQQSARLRECVEALDRLDGRGDYVFGLCASCLDKPKRLCATCPWLPQRRLEIHPSAKFCARVQKAVESGGLPETEPEDETSLTQSG